MTGIKKEKKEAWIEFFEMGFVVRSSHFKHTGPDVIYCNSHKNSFVMVISFSNCNHSLHHYHTNYIPCYWFYADDYRYILESM